MDLSKLPKFSQTPPPPPDGEGNPPEGQPAPPAAPPPVGAPLYCRCGAALPAGKRFCANCGLDYESAVGGGRSAGGGGVAADAWISIALGVILVFLSPRIWQYFFAPAKFTWTFNDPAGNPLAYTKTEFFWADLGLAAFAVVLVVEGLALVLARKAGVLMVALALTVVATVLNLYVLGRTYGGVGFQIMNALAAAFGVYIAIYEYSLLQDLRRGRGGRIVS